MTRTMERTATASSTTTPPPAHLFRWRNWWGYPLALGILITAGSGWLLFLANVNTWAGFWVAACIWPALLLGVFLTTLAWLAHRSVWMHVRVNTGEEWPRRIAISMPLPFKVGTWFFKVFQKKIPGVQDVPLEIDELLSAIQHSVTPETPIHIQVEEAGGERVEVYIG